LGPIEALPPDDPQAGLAAFTTPNVAPAVWQAIEKFIESGAARHATASYGPRLVQQETCDYLRPTVLECESPESPAANVEYMFPMVSVVRCPQAEMLANIGSTLVGTAITNDESFRNELIAATHIDRLNLGPIPTPQVDWLQPHEGNLIEFLYRNRALQVAE
jgi:acyl-CoA reductase-like NAD-dependent aldehyde dehydrogenase